MRKYTIIFSFFISSVWLFGGEFTLESDDIGGQLTHKQVYNGFGCSGTNTSPALSWSNAPKGTKSFAITMYDKDAPTGSGWWHWVVFDIPANVSSIATNSGDVLSNLMPKGAIQSITDYKKFGYGGACPPVGHGAHQYLITIYALDTQKLGIDKGANPALAGFMINSHTIAKASIVAYYAR